MKITRIYLKNLNSLRGEFIIDLDKEPFAGAGIFSITGPTGAGKSTILDALTLALYGRAARYDSKSNPENMMSRGTGECHAEVEFEVPKGRYRASWQMKRARGKSDGKMQPVSRYVYDSEGTVIAQNVSETNKIIEELTGLDVDQFFRSVLLAQGDFVKFLKATPDERATLLEKLTGTGIYTEISKRAHEETSKRAQSLKLREKDLDNIRLLSSEEHALLLKQIEEYKREIANNTQQQLKHAELIAKANSLDKNLKQETELKKLLDSLKLEEVALEPDRKLLQLFREGTQYFPELQNIDQLLKTLVDKQKDVDRAKTGVLTAKGELRAGVDAAAEMISERIARFEKDSRASSEARIQKQEKVQTLTLWLEANQKDQTLDVNLSHIVEQLTSFCHHRSRLKEILKKQNELVLETAAAQQRLTNLQAEKDAAAVVSMARKILLDKAQKAYLKILQGKTEEQLQQEIIELEQHLSFLIKKQELLEVLDRQNSEIVVLKDTLQDLASKHAEEQQQKALKENCLKVELEKIRQLKEERDENKLIASFHEHRENLAPGKSCPLCGSVDHPFIETAASFPKITDLEKELNSLTVRASEIDEELKKLISTSARLSENIRNTNEVLEKTSLKAEATQRSLDALVQENERFVEKNVETATDIHKEKKACDEKLMTVRGVLKQAQESEFNKSEIQKSVDSAQHVFELAFSKIAPQEEKVQALGEQARIIQNERISVETSAKEFEATLLNYLEPYGLAVPAYGEEKALREKLEKRRCDYQANLKQCSDLKNELSSLDIAARELELQCEKLNAQKEQLDHLLDMFEIRHIEIGAKKKIEFCARWNNIDDAKEELENLKTAQILAQSVLAESQKEFLKMQNSHSELEERLSQGLRGSRFETIENLRAAQLAPSESLCIQREEEDIKRRIDMCQGQLLHVQAELKSLANIDIPQGEQLLALQHQCNEMEKQTNGMRGSLALAENRRQVDEKNHLNYAKLFEEIEIERKNLSVWQKLSNLIGSHDGKNFRKFAQGLSLDLLIKHANNHLSLLNNRYRLKRTAGEELDLEIQDLYQANATRPTASLSGGESFLTSLALALGLSDLAGKNVRIDSLFIDEGFGSLDSETLEVAVQALESLRSKNKTIGVISHIELLKERISTQITIKKGSGGVSTMSFSA